MKKLDSSFFSLDALEIAPLLLGKTIVRMIDGERKEYIITELEVYCGENDTACHASKGKTKRTQVMYEAGGVVYVYLIYGMYWMLNFVTGTKDHPQAILIRGISGFNGPGKIGKELHLDSSFYGENLSTSNRLWVEDNNIKIETYETGTRIGIDYATEEWRNKPWRYRIKKES